MQVNVEEIPVIFEVCGDELVGILHSPSEPSNIGVLIVVGGPQYRIGSHRHFVEIARDIATAGYPVLRFDCRGMGDSEGVARDFQKVGDDVRLAADCLFQHVDSLSSYVAWGLCDAASAILMHMINDDRLRGIVLLNPWIRRDDTLARTTITHYYRKRFQSLNAWKRLISGNVSIRTTALDFMRGLNSVVALFIKSISPTMNSQLQLRDFRDIMRVNLSRFTGSVLIILADSDLTAAEFLDVSKSDKRWRKVLSNDDIEMTVISDADHTFSFQAAKAEVTNCTLAFLRRARDAVY